MHNHSPLNLKTSTPIWNAKDGLFAVINAVGFTALSFKTSSFPVVAALEYNQPIAGGQGLKVNGQTVAVNQAPESTTWISLIWQTWGEENLKILVLSEDAPEAAPIVDKVPTDYAYAESLTVAYTGLKPNINITDVSGPIDLTLSGTTLGASGLITLQITNELAAVNFVNGKAEGNHNYTVGIGEEIMIAYVHTSAGLKFYCANPNPAV